MTTTYAPVLGNNYGTVEYAKKAKDSIDHVIDFNKGAYGAYRVLQLLDRVCQATAMVLSEIGSTFATAVSALGKKLSTAWSFLILPRLPEVLKGAANAISTWGKTEGPEGYPMRANIKKVHDVFDAGASVCYGGSLVLGSTPLKNAGDVFNFGTDVTDLTMAAEDFGRAGAHLEDLKNVNNDALKERFEDTKKDALLRMVKAIASVASGAIGLLVLAFGGPILPAVVLLALSLTATITAISAHFLRETRNYDVVKFFEGSGKNINGVTVY